MTSARCLFPLLVAAVPMAAPAHATWSIIAVDLKTREVAVGCATCINNANLTHSLPVVRPGLAVLKR